jgi:hypothetical protein
MAKAQGNYEIASLGVVVNTKLKNQFEKQRKEFERDSSKRARVEWGFHGSSPQSITAISKEGCVIGPCPSLSSLLLSFLFLLSLSPHLAPSSLSFVCPSSLLSPLALSPSHFSSLPQPSLLSLLLLCPSSSCLLLPSPLLSPSPLPLVIPPTLSHLL